MTENNALEEVEPSDSFSMMDHADEQMVLDEIKGRAIDALVYEIKQGGQTIRGLSLAGVRETARNMNKNGQARIAISDREPVVIETDDYFEVKAYAQDTQNGGGYWGIKRQSKRYSTGSINAFALEQALAKAQRNALRGLIPEWFVKTMIEEWIERGAGIKTIGNSSTSGDYWRNKRGALVGRIIKDVPYYGKKFSDVIASLENLKAAKVITAEMSDDQIFAAVNQHASEQANKEAT